MYTLGYLALPLTLFLLFPGLVLYSWSAMRHFLDFLCAKPLRSAWPSSAAPTILRGKRRGGAEMGFTRSLTPGGYDAS